MRNMSYSSSECRSQCLPQPPSPLWIQKLMTLLYSMLVLSPHHPFPLRPSPCFHHFLGFWSIWPPSIPPNASHSVNKLLQNQRFSPMTDHGTRWKRAEAKVTKLPGIWGGGVGIPTEEAFALSPTTRVGTETKAKIWLWIHFMHNKGTREARSLCTTRGEEALTHDNLKKHQIYSNLIGESESIIS